MGAFFMGKANLIKHLAPHKAFDANAPFQKLKISNEFNGNVNQPYRRATDSAPVAKVDKLKGEDSKNFLGAAKQYYADNGTLEGMMNVATPQGIVGVKSNSRFNKDGTLSVKQKTQTAVERDKANRVFMMQEQTFGTDEFKKGHHRVGLELVERVLEGLSDNDRKRLVKLLNTQYDSITTGNGNKNIIPLPKPLHDLVHMRLREAGLDPKKMNFNSASFKDRLRFMRQVEYVLLDIDKLISKGLEDASDALVAKK